MISILIPVFNYDISILVEDLLAQCVYSKIDYEIICFDDASDPFYSEINQILKKNANVTYHISTANVGRIKARQTLATLANYNWLLFLDADVKITSDNFLQNYLDFLNDNFDAIFGGFIYSENKPHNKFMLRWKYGKNNESIPAKTRNLNPYKVVISANYMIKKEVFDDVYGIIDYNGYGYDNYFGGLLKQNNIRVLHLDNGVLHLGLEESYKFLSKKKKAANSLLEIYMHNIMPLHNNTLLKTYIKIKKLGFSKLFSGFYSLFKKAMKTNLLGKNPSIFLLQLYRLSYMCHKAKSYSSK